MYSLLLLNGGVGQRVGAGFPKQFVNVVGRPMLVYSLIAAGPIDRIDELVVNYPEGHRDTVEQLIADFAFDKPATLVPAGLTRQDSVRMLAAAAKNEAVILHEAARPLVTTNDFLDLIAAEHSNVGLMREIPFSVVEVEPKTGIVQRALKRSSLRNVQLPQKFATQDLVRAHEWAATRGLVFTEDSGLLVEAGYPVHFIEGHEENIKVTTPLDVILANVLINGENFIAD